ncbi:hypothetical protein HC891_21915 [Candidatus Gracilibacteria bacterium]|nr:hypothetical protein [Candidatus Gracilibacteria bacterium]
MFNDNCIQGMFSQNSARDSILLLGKREQHMFGAGITMAKVIGFLGGEIHDLACVGCQR